MPPPLDIPPPVDDQEDAGQDFRLPGNTLPAPVPSDPEPAPMIGAEALTPPPAPMISTIQRPQMSVRVPSQGFNDPNWQRRAEQQQMDIYKRAQSVEQAHRDVSSARRMLGILKADREIRGGTPVDKALYNNLNYFVQPADKNFTPIFKALQPPPMPQARSFPGTTLPPGVQMGNKFMWPSAAAVKAGQPAQDYAPKNIELGGEQYIYSPHTGHFERRDKGKTVDQLTPGQMLQSLSARSRMIQAQLKNATDKRAATLQGQLDDISMDMVDLSKGHIPGRLAKPITSPPKSVAPAPTAPVTDRVRVRSKDGKVGTIPKSQLEEAQKAGYSVVQ